MNIIAIKSKFEHVMVSCVSGAFAVYLILEGLLILPALNQWKGWLNNTAGAGGLIIIPLAPLAFFATILGITLLLIGLILIITTIGIYKKNNLAIIIFFIISILLSITFYKFNSFMPLVALLISMTLSIKILHKQKGR